MKTLKMVPKKVEKVVEHVVESTPEIVEEEDGMENLLGKQVLIFGSIYIYAGKLVGVNTTCIKLEDPCIVYETGSFQDKTYKDAQRLPHKFHYIERRMIESWGEGK